MPTDSPVAAGKHANIGDGVRVADLGEVAFWFAAAAILVYALFIALPEPFVKDCFVYLAMVRALVEHGSLAIDNGYADYASPALTYQFLIPVDGRLMPQYPSGWAFVAAPFYALGGVRGIFLLDALATVLTLWLIRLTGRTLFGDDRIGLTAALLYAFATYAFDYAGAIWPHAPAIACSTGALAAAALGWRRDAPGWFAVAGLAIGIGVSFRVDVVLTAPAIGLWILGASPRPWRDLACFAAGSAPGLLAAAGLNAAKFGTFNPISYGRGDPKAFTSVAYYARFLPFVAVAALGALSLTLAPVRRGLFRPAGCLAVLGAGLAAVALVPALQDAALRLVKGGADLVVAMELFPDSLGQANLTVLPDGMVLANGWAKKALLQSLPYAAVVPLLVPGLFRGRHRAGIALCLLIALTVLFPFAYTGWRGGRANHMRYLLQIAPMLVLLTALAMQRIAQVPRRSLGLAVAAGLAVPALGWLLGAARGREALAILQRDLPNVLVIATLALVLAALLLRNGAGRAAYGALQGTVWAGIVTAGISAWGIDTLVHQKYRAANMALTVAARDLPADAFVITLVPNWMFERIGEPRTTVAGPTGPDYFDTAQVRRALDAGRPVYVQNRVVLDKVVAAGLGRGGTLAIAADHPYYEVYRLEP